MELCPHQLKYKAAPNQVRNMKGGQAPATPRKGLGCFAALLLQAQTVFLRAFEVASSCTRLTYMHSVNSSRSTTKLQW